MRRLLIVLILAAAQGCEQPPTVEQRIIAEIRDMEARIEEGARLNFMSHFAEDFRGQGGRMNRDQLRAFVVLQLRRYEKLNARLLPITAQEIGDREATAEFRVLLTGGSGWLPESGQMYRIRTHWRLDDGDWLVVAAWWEPLQLSDLDD